MKNKTTRIILFFFTSIIVILLLSNNSDIIHEQEAQDIPDIAIEPVAKKEPIPKEPAVETEIDVENIVATKTDYSAELKAKNLKPSQFNKRCLDDLTAITEKTHTDVISKATQTKIMNIFNTCVYEIDMELALTEKEFGPTASNQKCLNTVYGIRDKLLELGVDAQNFGSLPNDTELNRSDITTSFIRISNNIIVEGSLAMKNRGVNCSPN